jgi:transposase
MSVKERIRLEALGRVKRKEITLVRAAELAGVSLRQMRRLWKRYASDGDGGLIHRSRGKRPNNRLSDAKRAAIVELCRSRYGDFGPTFACEKLAADDHHLSPDTLTTLLKEAGLWQPRRRRGKHRTRRPRRPCFGELLQMDGSEHDWFEGRGERCVLMVAIDDATNQTHARFHRRETLDAAFDLFGRWAGSHGLPRALYVDRAGIYRCDREPSGDELLSGQTPVTQFGRAMAELGVELILANSPEAKGRVERRNAVFQDRLVKELRLAGIGDIEQANALLDHSFLAELNARFHVEPVEATDAHRALEPAHRLDEILCQQELRVVGNDWCVRWNNAWLQIDRCHQALALPGKQILVFQKRDGSLLLKHQGESLHHNPVAQRPPPPKPPKPIVKNNKTWKPPASHPWKRNLAPSPATICTDS